MNLIGSLKKIFWKKEVEDVTLTDVIRGLQHCINQSKELNNIQYVSELQKYFYENGDEFSPIYQTLKIGQTQAINLPIVCLFEHNSINLEEMEVAMDLTIKNMTLKSTVNKSKDGQEETDVPEDISRTAFAVDLNSARLEGDYSKLELKFKFKAGAVPEAISRVIDKLNGQVAVYEYENKGDKE